MKFKNIKLISSVLLLSSLCACTSLDVDVKSEYTDDNFPTTDADMEAICGPAYTTYKSTYGRWTWTMETCSSDEAVMVVTGGTNWYDGGRYMQLDLHTFSPGEWIYGGVFDGLFTGIAKCNQIMKIMDAAPDTPAKTTAYAQMRTMRALYYFWAMDYFGDLPILKSFGDDDSERAPRAQVADFIASELKDCIDKLPTTVDNTTYGKPTRYMAEALLAKLYLNWAVYTTNPVSDYTPSVANSHLNDVVTCCDDIIKSGKYDLSDDWINKFKDDNGYKIKDFIFAFAYDWVNDDKLIGGGLTHSRFWGHKYMQYTFAMNKKPSGPMRAYPEFVNKYNLSGDVRNNIWRGDLQHYESDATKKYTVSVAKSTLDNYYTGTDGSTKVNWDFTLSKELIIRGKDDAEKKNNIAQLNLGGDETGLAMGYRNMKIYPSAASTNNCQGNDMPILRYADILLMKAEAILRGATATNGETVVSLVNQIRNCAKAPTVTTFSLSELLDERAREFSEECWRRNDLIRFGHFEDDWGFKSAAYGLSNTDKYRRIYPLYTTILQQHTSWKQNPGY